ncbi:MAG: hypothetical protein IPP48_03045 [Chitinophagaceae bacterium]|nr:hypothetical protein [Chitinophagaceae bacterium]
MKKLIPAICNIVFLLSSITILAQENEKKKYEHEKKKVYEKTYALSSSDKVKISNQFGSVKINTWDKSEIKITVEMIATAKNEDRAADILESLSIADKKNGNVVSFKTVMDNDKGNNNGGSSTMDINYTVYMPSDNALDLKNEFGPIVLPDYNGNVEIESKFGSLTTGKLNNVEEIVVEFGKAKIGSIGNGTATFKFSKIEVNHLKGNCTLKFEFCQNSKVVLDNDATLVNINESYSKLNIKPSADFSATYDVRTSFGSFKNRTGSKFSRTDEEPDYGADTDKDYEGQTGNGACKVKIKSSFGNVILGEATAEEMKSKKEKGSKNKEEDEDE